MISKPIIARYHFQPEAKPVPGERLIRLLSEWFFTINGVDYWLPAGYVANGASIPPLVWPMLMLTPFDPRLWPAFFGHDWGYLTHILPRWVLDEMYRQLAIQAGIDHARARTMWSALRPAGAFAWGNNKAETAELNSWRETLSPENRPDWEKFHLVK